MLSIGGYEMNKYVVKNQNNKQNKNVFGMTDYDIPMFGFKSALKKTVRKAHSFRCGMNNTQYK